MFGDIFRTFLRHFSLPFSVLELLAYQYRTGTNHALNVFLFVC